MGSRKPKRVRKRPRSISRWAKDHRDLLATVQFRRARPDPKWRKKRAYNRFRDACLQRDSYRCQRCGKPAKTVHHRIPAAICEELRYEVANGITLCEDCHDKEPHQYDPAFWERMTRGRDR